MQKWRLSCLLLGIVGLLTQGSAQTSTISGKVINTLGQGIAGVNVSLEVANLQVMTNSDGNYSFAGAAPIANSKSQFHFPELKFSGNNLYIMDVSNTGLKIELKMYGPNGSSQSTLFNGLLTHSETKIPLLSTKIAQGVYFISLETPYGHAIYKCAIHSNHQMQLSFLKSSIHSDKKGDAVNASHTAQPLSKILASGDWLSAVKTGYSSYVQSVASYEGTINITLGNSTTPDFGPQVYLFNSTMPMASIQKKIDSVHNIQAQSQFSTSRYAYLFAPGQYNLTVDVDYYTQAAGLGNLPDDVMINGTVQSKTTTSNNNVTLMFWRGAENMYVLPPAGTINTWAVSQAAPFRRMHVKGGLALSMGGWASGGFLADSKIEGIVAGSSQQQWFTRNSDITSWSGGNWNMTFVGVNGAPTEAWPTRAFTTVATAPIIREKPYLIFESGAYSVLVPGLRANTSGASWVSGVGDAKKLPIDLFYIANPSIDNASTINAALAQGKNLLVTPGIYRISEAIKIVRPNTVVLGLGLATFIPTAGNAGITIADVHGVKVAGVIVDAGSVNSPVLIQVGETGSNADHTSNPTSLHDVYCRVGGGSAGQATTCMIINSNNVIGDHFWLWRADHGAGAGWNSNKSKNGLIVNGNDVTIYGQFNEHFQEYQSLWNGNRGRNYFFQSEMPYDPPSQTDWQHGTVKGYAAYKVADNVTHHEARGMGAYCVFYAGPIWADNAFESPEGPNIQMRHMVTSWLNGQGGINNVYNGKGGAATTTSRQARVD